MKWKTYWKQELMGWKPWEVLWLFIASTIILGLSIFWQQDFIGILSALTGVWCVILTGKGKRSSFLFGVINVLLYAWISLGAKYYGEVMLNLLYYFPMNFVGWFLWNKHMDNSTGEVTKRNMPTKKRMILYGVTACAIVGYGCFLKRLGGAMPFVDSTSTTISVAAQLLSVWRMTEQWVLWIFVDVVTIVMWAVHFAQGGDSIATLAMWSVYLVNAVLMYIRWNREAKIYAV